MLVCGALTGAWAAAPTAVATPPASLDTAVALGLVAYLEERFAQAVEIWRSVVDAGATDGVLLYRYAFALEKTNGDERHIAKIRKRALKSLQATNEGNAGAVECVYLAALDDDARALRTRRHCYDRLKGEIGKDGAAGARPGDAEALYFLARLTEGHEDLVKHREALLRSALAAVPAAGDEAVAPSRGVYWLDNILHDLGALLIDADRDAEAVELLTTGLQSFPHDDDLRGLRASALWSLGRNAEAETDYRALVNGDPKDAGNWRSLGFALWAQDKNAEALEAFAKAVALGDVSASVSNGAGLAYHDSGRLMEAVREYRETIRRDPEWARPHYNLARALAQLHDAAPGAGGAAREAQADEIEKAIGNAIRLEPDAWDYHKFLGERRAGQGRNDEALAAYRAGLAAGAATGAAHGAIGELLTKIGRPADALEPLRLAVAAEPAVALWHRHLGAAFEALKRHAEAEREYREAVRLQPHAAPHLGFLASLLAELGREGEALETYARAEDVDPRYMWAMEQTAIVKEKTGGSAAVIAYLEPRLERFRDNGPMLRRLGIALEQAGRVADAERLFRQATETQPGYDRGWDALAVRLEAAKRIEDAIVVVRQGLGHSPSSVQLLFRLGSLLDTAGRPAEAEPFLKQALLLNDESATIWNALGAVYDHLAKRDEAVAAFRTALAKRAGFTLAQLNLGRVFRTVGRRAEAIVAFQAVVRADPKEIDAWIFLAEQLVLERRFDEARDALEKGLAARPEHPSLLNIRGDLLSAEGKQNEALAAYRAAQPAATDNDFPFRKESEILHERKDYVEELESIDRWLGRFPKSARAMRQRGLTLMQLQRYDDARQAVQQAIDLSADDWIAWAVVGDIEFNRENWEAAREGYARSTKLNPKHAPTQAFLGASLLRLRRPEEAVTAYREAIALDPRAQYRVNLAEAMRSAGKPDEAETLLTRGLQEAAEPPAGAPAGGTPAPDARAADRAALRRALADLYEATARPALAVQHLEALAAERPNDLDLRRALARSQRGAGQLKAAARTLEAALQLDGDDQEALAMLRALPKGIADAEEFIKSVRPAPLSIDPVDTRAALARFRPDDPEVATLLVDAGMIGLEDHLQVQVRPGGLLTQTNHQVLRPLDRATAEALGEYRIAYVPAREQLEVHIARTHLPDGRTIDAAPEAYHRVSPPDTTENNVYSDAEILVISLPQVQPGAAIEVQFTKKMKSTLTDQQWWLSWWFQGGHPYVRSRLVVRAPKGAPVRYAALGDAPSVEVREEEDAVIYSWTAINSPGMRSQTNAPAVSGLRSAVTVTSYESWDHVASWFQGLLRNQYDLDAEARAQVEELTAGATGPLEKTRRLYDYVQRVVRYVSVDFGIGAYQPRRAIDTLRTRFGDCKDRGTLLIALLRAAGIRAYPALVLTRDDGLIRKDAPAPGQFNHLIVHIPDLATPIISDARSSTAAKGMFIDATTDHADLGTLPAIDQGIDALVIEDGRGRFVRTPVSSPADNTRILKRTIAIGADGAAKVTDDAVASGYFALLMRDVLAGYDERGRRDLVTESVRKEFPGASDIDFTFSGIDGPGEPPRDHETYRVSDLVQSVGASWVIPLDLSDMIAEMVPITPATERRLDYHVDTPFILEGTTDVELPVGRGFSEWPRPVRLDGPYASFDLSFAAVRPGAGAVRRAPQAGAMPAKLRLTVRFVQKEHVVPRADYAAFAALVERAIVACRVSLLARPIR